MAKQYNFTIEIRKATFDKGYVCVKHEISFGTSTDPNVLQRAAYTGTLDGVIAARGIMSARFHEQPHRASIRMANRADRKPAGFEARTDPLYHNPANTPNQAARAQAEQQHPQLALA